MKRLIPLASLAIYLSMLEITLLEKIIILFLCIIHGFALLVAEVMDRKEKEECL